MKNSLCLLWLEGVRPERLSAVPFLTEQAKNGVDLQLVPLPLSEKSVCYYQTLTGMGSGKLGRFDAVYPSGYKAQEDTGVPDGAYGRLLPDLLRSKKLEVTFLEAKNREILNTLADQSFDCAIVHLLDMGNAGSDELDAMLRRCAGRLAPETHLLVLADAWGQPAQRLVNINDFLADVGLLETRADRGQAHIVWSETLAYGLGTGQVWVNLRGREPEGIVGSGREYQDVCDALINELRTNWRDPETNELVVEQVLRREEAYSGDYLFKAPDLIVVYRPGYAASPKAIALDFDGQSVHASGQAIDAPPAAPFARLTGSGPCLAHGFAASGKLVDLVPNLLYLLDRPVPTYIDGNVISPMFTPSYREQTPIRQLDSDDELLSDEEEGMIVDRLRDLGYLG
ncbi:MAG TPA: hypothetical protein VKV20_08570 [Ktedonobacteraceae bacterium]|jgi:hypothetical protein|nr:hypothetical protein [Ktedonobacteraceae bacterium]